MRIVIVLNLFVIRVGLLFAQSALLSGRSGINVDMKYKQILTQDFYSDGLMESKYLDRTIYSGKGRPKKSDYQPLLMIQKNLRVELTKALDNQIFDHKC